MRSWNWIPGVSVGELAFGSVLVPESFDFCVERLPPSCDEADWETYCIENEMGRISAVDGKIVDVECVSSLRLNQNELLGLHVSEVNRLLPKPATLGEVYGDGDERWECEELGLVLWVEEGVVTSATVSARSDEDG